MLDKLSGNLSWKKMFRQDSAIDKMNIHMKLAETPASQMKFWNQRTYFFSGHVAEGMVWSQFFSVFFPLMSAYCWDGTPTALSQLKRYQDVYNKHWKVPTIYVLGPQVPPWILQKVLLNMGTTEALRPLIWLEVRVPLLWWFPWGLPGAGVCSAVLLLLASIEPNRRGA